MAASPYLTVLKKEPLSVPPEKAEGGDDLLGLGHYTAKIRTLCCNNPCFAQVLSDTTAYIADKIENGSFKIIWGPPPYFKILEFETYSPWKPARTAAERLLREALETARAKAVQSNDNPGNDGEDALSAAVLGVDEVVGGTMLQAFNSMALSAKGARQETRQIALAKWAIASAVQASMAFTKAVLFDTVDAAKVEFVASGEYEVAITRTCAFGRGPDKTEEDKRIMDDLVRREICKYMISNPAQTEAFGYRFECEKDKGKWIATEQARKNGLTVREAVAGVLPLPELQKIAAKAAIEAVLNKRNPKAAADKAVDARIEADARRVAEAVVALNFSGAKAEVIRPLGDSLATMRELPPKI